MSVPGPPLYLNVGCGDCKAPAPWCNIDAWTGVDPDVWHDITTRWPFPDGSAARIYMGQILEHLDHPDGVTACLAEAARVISPSGTVLVVSPDWSCRTERPYPDEIWAALDTGARRWPGDEHRWRTTRQEIARLLERHFDEHETAPVSLVDDLWPPGNRDPWDCAVYAWKKTG